MSLDVGNGSLASFLLGPLLVGVVFWLCSSTSYVLWGSEATVVWRARIQRVRPPPVVVSELSSSGARNNTGGSDSATLLAAVPMDGDRVHSGVVRGERSAIPRSSVLQR